MRGLSGFSRKYGLPLQSHLSESIGEIAWVKALHPECEDYTDVYKRFGSLHSASFMAHCVHSDPHERQVLKETGKLSRQFQGPTFTIFIFIFLVLSPFIQALALFTVPPLISCLKVESWMPESMLMKA